jgi:two-component system, OmpR family, phosphate regulon sensor histidine kinase PhoR
MRLLMLLAILMIAGFQVVWLFESYQRENRLLRNELSAIFRETALGHFFPEALRADSFRDHHIYSNLGENEQMMIIMKKDSLKIGDSSLQRNLPPDFERHIRIGSGNEMMSSFVSPNQLLADFSRQLEEEGYSFQVKILPAMPADKKRKSVADTIYTHTVPVCLSENVKNPIPDGFYNAAITGFKAHLLKRIWPQLALSFLLIFVTVLAFYVLWRNMNTQQQLLRQKDQLVSNITHELKTPVATVSVALEAIQRFDSAASPERTKEYLGIAQQQLQRLNLLIDKVLRLSMFEGGKIELSFSTVALNDIAEEVVQPLKLQFEAAGGTLLWEPENEPLIIYADKQHITSLLFNLLDNALKYGGTPPHAVLRIFTENNFAVMEVSDNGSGIDESYRQKIFEPFFRIPGRGSSHNVKGHGLGLSYVAEIVRRHHGTVEVKNHGKGAVFSVKLPLNNG